MVRGHFGGKKKKQSSVNLVNSSIKTSCIPFPKDSFVIVIVLFINKVVKRGLDHISRKVNRSFHYSQKMK